MSIPCKAKNPHNKLFYLFKAFLWFPSLNNITLGGAEKQLNKNAKKNKNKDKQIQIKQLTGP